MLRNGLFLIVLLLASSCFRPIQPVPPEPEHDYKVQMIYMAPISYTSSQLGLDKSIAATIEIQRYLQAATGGKTFEYLNDNDIVDVYEGTDLDDHPFYNGFIKAYEAHLNAVDSSEVQPVEVFHNSYTQAWQKKYEENLLSNVKLDLQSAGYDVESRGIMTVVWLDGMDHHNLDSAVYREILYEGAAGITLVSINAALAGDWLPSDLSGPIHSMGHLFGLEHPIEASDLPLSEEQQILQSSFMSPANLRSGSNTNEFGFLTMEKAILDGIKFLKTNVPIYQRYWSTKILNYPSTGMPPDASFSFNVTQFAAVEFSVAAPEDHTFYWYFDDGSTSNEREPAHNYNSGMFNVTLMVTSPNYMTSRYSQFVEVP